MREAGGTWESVDKVDHATVQIIVGVDDFHLPLVNQFPNDIASGQDPGGITARVLAYGVVDEIPRLALL